MTLQPWRIYNPSFRYRHSVYEGLNAHVLARDDGRDQPPGGLPPGPQAALPLIMHEMTHLRCQSQFPSLCFFELLSAASSVSADRGVRVSVFCSAPIQARAGLRSSLTLRPLSSDVATSPPSFLPQRPVPARVVGASMDYDYSFDSPRSPVFVEGGGASSTGWPLHRMTLQPWRIYVTAATNAQGASRQARRLLCP